MFLPRRRNRRRIAVTERSFADLFSTFFESDEIEIVPDRESVSDQD